jgi:hypothetical protein
VRVVAARDDFEEQVGVATVVRQIADLIDAQELRRGEASQATREHRRTVLCHEFGEHVTGGRHSHGVAADQAVMCAVAQDHAFAYTVGPEQNDVDAVVEKPESE